MAKYIPSMVFLAFGNEVLSLAALSVVMVFLLGDLLKARAER